MHKLQRSVKKILFKTDFTAASQCCSNNFDITKYQHEFLGGGMNIGWLPFPFYSFWFSELSIYFEYLWITLGLAIVRMTEIHLKAGNEECRERLPHSGGQSSITMTTTHAWQLRVTWLALWWQWDYKSSGMESGTTWTLMATETFFLFL